MSTATVAAEGPVSDLDPFSDAFVVDPFPALEQLRTQGPAVHLSRYGIWTVAGYPEVHALLRDHGRFDPRQWPDPHRFDVRRKVAGHLGYGVGPHVCAGMSIARMEGQAVIRALAERVAGWELTGEATPKLNNSLRGLSSLPVRVIPR